MENAQFANVTLRKSKNLGVRIAVDDFGPGHSSFSRLKHLPTEALKIDRSFIHGLGESAEDKLLVSGMIGIASGLGLKVVAEGVECCQQLAQLRTLGCELAQGYYFSGPLPPGEAASALLAINPQW